MTCQITSLLKEKAVTASDSAVTVNNSKAWKNVEKTFRLSEDPPINIMINGSPTINNFPVKLLIDEFEKIVKSDDIEEIADEFLDFIGKTVPKTNVEKFIMTLQEYPHLSKVGDELHSGGGWLDFFYKCVSILVCVCNKRF